MSFSICDQVDDDLLPDFHIPSSLSDAILEPTPKPVANRQRKSPATDNENDENPDENEKKKIAHRDVERQRRREMASLHSSIRSLLPKEYVKGKRSVSDHLHETVNYIKYLQKKVGELSQKRDAMKRLSNFSAIDAREQLQNYRQDLVMARESYTGVEIIIDTAIADHGLQLSTLFQVLEDESLQIVSCISTKINDRPLHTIASEVNGGRRRDLHELQKRLTNLVLLHLI